MVFIACIVIAYFVGAVPTGFLVAQFFGIRDITQHGSGNIGATNVARTLGKPLFFLVFFIDAAKALLVMHAASAYNLAVWQVVLCAGAVLVGNGTSIFLRGKGGKGVATFVGILAALSPVICFSFIGLWALLVGLTRNIGIASVAAALSLPILAVVSGYYASSYIAFFTVSSVWIAWRHADNIRRYYVC